jgi:hypothetical protein
LRAQIGTPFKRDTLFSKIDPRSVGRVWNVTTEKHVERAVAIGERNSSTLELLRNWCAHIVVEKRGGGGLLEQQTGLPIGPRSLTCPHAAARGFIGSDLNFLALDFYDRNCAGCAKRKPDLSILLQEREAAARRNLRIRPVARRKRQLRSPLETPLGRHSVAA